MLIIGSGFLLMALSKSTSHHNKSSLHVPILPSGGIPGNSSLTNLNGLHSQSSSSSLYSAPPPCASDLAGNISNGLTSSNKKVVMIGFDDGWKSQITYAKPILDKYGLKASFFVVCNYVNSGDIGRMNWQDRMDVKYHTMDHKPLDTLSTNALIYETACSKQCLASHGIDLAIFAYPFNLGSNKPAIVNMVAKYYNFC